MHHKVRDFERRIPEGFRHKETFDSDRFAIFFNSKIRKCILDEIVVEARIAIYASTLTPVIRAVATRF
jgi:hypothetical protein